MSTNKVIEVSSEFKNALHTANGRAIHSDSCDHDLFMEAYKQLKSGVTKAQLNAVIERGVPSVAFQRTYKGLVTLADRYTSMKVITNLDLMMFDTVKRVVNVLRFIGKEYDESTVKKVKGRITKTWESGMSPHRYNNAVDEVLVALKKEYPHKEVEGELVAFSVEGAFGLMTEVQKHEMLLLLVAAGVK